MRLLLLSVFLCISAISHMPTYDMKKEISATAQNIIRNIEDNQRISKEIVALSISDKRKSVVKVSFIYGANSITPEVSCVFKYNVLKAKVVSHTLACKAV
ncbi:MAG TPA: hypothetical protein VNJ01_14225 [Bacteriovoracaceae bacterium]|nr:hypothetical protein [Bacteriovoracaceae bacterium]